MEQELSKSFPVYMCPENVRSFYLQREKKLILIFFSLTLELGQLSGVAAILRFPLPELDEDSEDSDDPD